MESLVNCRQITKCSQINDKNNCGYCAYDKEFRYGTKDGPSADVCPKEAWTTDANKCQELREKQLCAAVKSCGDLYGEAEEICGYCPTTGVAMVMKKAGDKYVPKYPDDVCNAEGYGLLPGSKCGQFLKDHPCITPYYLSGPQPEACLKKLWKNSGCTSTTPLGQSFANLSKSIMKGYKEIGVSFKKTNTDTRSTDYNTAVTTSDLCFGNHDNIKPCDMKYNRQGIPNPACLKGEFLDVGCTEKGTVYKGLNTIAAAKNQVKKVNKYIGSMCRIIKLSC